MSRLVLGRMRRQRHLAADLVFIVWKKNDGKYMNEVMMM